MANWKFEIGVTWLITSKSHSAVISSGSRGINPEVRISDAIFGFTLFLQKMFLIYFHKHKSSLFSWNKSFNVHHHFYAQLLLLWPLHSLFRNVSEKRRKKCIFISNPVLFLQKTSQFSLENFQLFFSHWNVKQICRYSIIRSTIHTTQTASSSLKWVQKLFIFFHSEMTIQELRFCAFMKEKFWTNYVIKRWKTTKNIRILFES